MYSGKKSHSCVVYFLVFDFFYYTVHFMRPVTICVLSLSVGLIQCLSHNIYALIIWWMNGWMKLIKGMSKWANMNSNYSKYHNIERELIAINPTYNHEFSLSLAFIRNDQMTHHLYYYIMLCVPWTFLTKLNYMWNASYAHTLSMFFFFELLFIKTSMISFGHWFPPSVPMVNQNFIILQMGDKWFLCTPQVVIGFLNSCCFLVSLAYAFIPLYK